MSDPWLPAYEPETGCAGPTVGAKAFRDWVLANYGGGDLGIARECSPAESGHEQGTAWDWGLFDSSYYPDHGLRFRKPVRVEELIDDLTRNRGALARRLGVMYLIYDRQGWYAYPRHGKSAGSWHPYGGKSAHVDHVHFSLSRAGAEGRTSGYSVDNGNVTVEV